MIHRYKLAGVAAGLTLVLGLAAAPTLVDAQSSAGQPEALAAAGAGLEPVSSFASISDEKERSIAIFQETGKVIQHPRCLNCHPADDRPLQGMDMHEHMPPVFRGEANFGLAGMECTTCHTQANVELVAQAEGLQSIPGNPNWHLAPIEMAWVGKSLAEICVQIKDEERNGGKSLAELVHHMAEDDLVGWGWNPGKGREPVPGTQAQFGELFQAWADSGAHCPGE